MSSPAKAARTLLALVIGATTFLDYWSYSQQFYREPAVYTDVLRGTASAPIQYRLGAVYLASFIAKLGHLGLRHGMTIVDGISVAIAVYLLYSVLERSASYQAASNHARWFGSAVFVLLVQFYLAWITWYQRPETLPTAALTAASLWLFTSRSQPGRSKASRFRPGTLRSSLPVGTSLVLVATAQALVRADVTVAVFLGVLLICLFTSAEGLALSRGVLVATSLSCVAVGAGIQYGLSHVLYPTASYGSTPVFQLVLNVKDRLRIFPFVIFMTPWAWTLLRALRKRDTAPNASMAMLTGSTIFLALWCVVGKIDEVRIFLPFAVALVPLTAQLAMQEAAEPV